MSKPTKAQGEQRTLFPGGSEWMQEEETIPEPSPFDFDVPEWMCPCTPCPMPPETQSPPIPVAEMKKFLITRAFHLEEWLAGMGYERKVSPRCLGLSFDSKSRTVRREGYPFFVRLGGKAAGLFSALLHAGPTGIKDDMLRNAYPGTDAARRKAVDEMRKKLEPLDVTVSDRHWALIERRKEQRG